MSESGSSDVQVASREAARVIAQHVCETEIGWARFALNPKTATSVGDEVLERIAAIITTALRSRERESEIHIEATAKMSRRLVTELDEAINGTITNASLSELIPQAAALRSRELAVWQAVIQIVEDYDSLTAAAWDVKYGDVELRDALAAKAQSFRKEGE